MLKLQANPHLNIFYECLIVFELQMLAITVTVVLSDNLLQ